MKTIFYISEIACIILAFNTRTESRIISIFATNNPAFYPQFVNAEVGDTIRWTGGGGGNQEHETICDGSTGTVLPPGAVPWSSSNLYPSGFNYVIRTAGYYRYKCGYLTHYGEIDATITNTFSNSISISDFYLSQNYPNPFNPTTIINYSIPRSGNAKLSIYDATGKEIDFLINEFRESGSYNIKFDGSNLSSGVYYYKLESNGFTEIKKMALIK